VLKLKVSTIGEVVLELVTSSIHSRCPNTCPTFTSHKLFFGTRALVSLNGSFIIASFAFNRLSHKYFWWGDNIFKKREKNEFHEDKPLLVRLPWWVIESNVYKIKEWNYICIKSDGFIHVSLHSMFFETTYETRH